ncbi:hypothetical protein AUC69_13520 [Methyloceanibacter superfactus]|uniref:Uncharacterized protein n=1 Tax=Methyloceanibacter superfactus TaxID=1774969 RepID=A0A1E3VSW3_9HYPH|nr:hypothetical protein [Methyloceanibacter superfactus]ODR96630.1 hypothetical protein AUC69_13520 [Methyloceanibacter superfactus]
MDGDDGLWLDITGVSHLFGGESALLADLEKRLAGAGLTVRLGAAETLGGAHALARFARARRASRPPARSAPHWQVSPSRPCVFSLRQRTCCGGSG